MARPAGWSSDDDDDDDDGFEFSDPTPRQNNISVWEQVNGHPKKDDKVSLLSAVLSENLEEIANLLNGDHETDVGINDILGGDWSALKYACHQGSEEVIKILLEFGANANCQNNLFTPFMALCKSDCKDEERLLRCAKLLIDNNIDINAKDKFRMTGLMFAASGGHEGLVAMLLEMNCDIESQDFEGWTALFFAVYSANEEIVKMLIDAGANVDVVDKRSRTAYKLAQEKGFTHIAPYICSEQDMLNKFLCEQPTESKKERDAYDQIVSELPSTNGNSELSGFPSDVIGLLLGMDMMQYANNFEEQNVQLVEFLTITDGRLRGLGIGFSAHRNNILHCLRKFHLYGWSAASISENFHGDVDLTEGVVLMANMTRHLLVLQATIKHITNNLPPETEPKVGLIASKINEQLLSQMKAIKSVTAIAKRIENNHKVIPADLILPNMHRGWFHGNITKLFVISLLIGGTVAWKFRLLKLHGVLA